MGGTAMTEEQWGKIIEDCDKNGDGQISKNEFVELMLKKEM